MIRETHIDRNINRLLAHFGSRLVGRPPATASELAALEELAGPLPRDLSLFFTTSNGLRLELAAPWPYAHLWSIHETRSLTELSAGPAMPQGFLPIAGGESERDWIILEPGAVHGAIVRCDPWAGPRGLIASCFETYFDGWTSFAIKSFDGQGRRRADGPAITFAGAGRHDPGLHKLRNHPDAKALVGELRMTVACGADFE
jgi:hypothetical protein